MADLRRTAGENIPWVPIATVVFGLAASGVLLFPFLTSSRPITSWSGGSEGMSIQDVDARLWQDPLEAMVSTHHHAGTSYDSKTHSIDLVRTELTENVSRPLILAVMVNGSGYAEKIERRLRDRVAVENALDRAGYSPRDAEHLGSFTVPWPRFPQNGFPIKRYSSAQASSVKKLWETNVDSTHLVLNADSKQTGTVPKPVGDWRRDDWDTAWAVDTCDCTWLTVPFEMHTRDIAETMTSPIYDRILVLWLRQDFFEGAPLARLAQLLSWFQRSDRKVCASVRILGPDTSDSLLQLTKEVRDAQDPAPPLSKDDREAKQAAWAEVKQILTDTSMFAFRPSASDQILLDDDSVKDSAVAQLVTQRCKGLNFYRTTPTDDVLLKALIDELSRRRIRAAPPALGGNGDSIAIISEQDTLFARALPATFNLLLHQRREPPHNVELLSYLRGIDGRVPQSTSGSSFNTRAPASGGNPAAGSVVNVTSQRGPRESPEGTDQSDYMRRQSAHLEMLSRLRKVQSPDGAGIKAVGVLGSDVYDKLEILHALRPRLRAKVFFTSGLDARFYHPEELSATRNLVVVSGFGLSLDHYYQGAIPPFRDHNQTAAFASTLCALGVMDPEKIDFNGQAPRIFEISKNGPVDLSVDAKNDLQELHQASPPTDIHPARHDLRNWWRASSGGFDWKLIGPLAALLILAASLVFARYSIWCDSHESSLASLGKSTTITLSLATPIILLILGPIYYQQRLTGEPFALFSGASMWPTEGIRLLVFFLGIHFVIKSLILLKENEREIAPAFGFDKVEAKRPEGWSWLFWRSKNPSGPKIMELWAEYLFRSKRRWRLAGTAVWFVLYTVAVLLFFRFFDSYVFTPARGELMFNLDVAIVWLAVLSSNFLTLFVVHATLLDARFTRLLSKGSTDWPMEVRKMHQRDAGASFLGEYLDVILIARRTRAVTKLIYYPLITISLLVICRLPEFDNFDWPTTLILILSLNALLACTCVAILRRLAEAARRDSLERLRVELRKSRSAQNRVKRKAIEDTIQEVKELDQGIFAPLTRQPVIAALLLPSGSAGIWALLQFLR